MPTWPRGTDFDTFPAQATGLPSGTILTTENSIFSATSGSNSFSGLVLDDTHAHSGSLSVTAGGTSSTPYETFQLGGDAGLIEAETEDFTFWMYYGAELGYSDGLLRTGADAANTQWLTHYFLYSGALGFDHANYDWDLLSVQVRARGPGYYGIAEWIEWRVVFYEEGGDTYSSVMISPLDTWVKIRVQVPLSGPITVTFSTEASELGVATSSANLLRPAQYFAAHDLIVRREGQYGQVWFDDINYDTVPSSISVRGGTPRREFT